MFKIPDGPTAFFDCDDTLVLWNVPEGTPSTDLVETSFRGLTDLVLPNHHNIDLLKKFAKRGITIVVWSAGGSGWASEVVRVLELEKYVTAITPKPHYFVDDIFNPIDFMGKHIYIDIDGKMFERGKPK